MKRLAVYLLVVYLLLVSSGITTSCLLCYSSDGIIDEKSDDTSSVPIYRINILQDEKAKEKFVMFFGQLKNKELDVPKLVETNTLPRALIRNNKEFSIISSKRYAPVDYDTANFTLQLNVHEIVAEKVFVISGEDVYVFTNPFYTKEK